MGRENLEDYNASFLIILETWEAVALSAFAGKSSKPIDIAELLVTDSFHPLVSDPYPKGTSLDFGRPSEIRPVPYVPPAGCGSVRGSKLA